MVLAIHKISPLATFCAAFYVKCSAKLEIPLFLFLFDTLAIKTMAFHKISLISHQNLPFLKCVKVVK